MTQTAATKEWGPTVHGYVGEVRAALADLPPEDVDELTGGLEADLGERAAELDAGADLPAAFGTPQAYAAELRAAAGLPPAAVSSPDKGPGFVQALELQAREARTRVLAARPWLADLRSTWWLGRGAVLGGLAKALVLSSSGRAALLVLMGLGAAASFWWSRRREFPASSLPNRLTVLANVAAALLLLPIGSMVLSPDVHYVDMSGPPPFELPRSGVWVNGEVASNLYAYDAQGSRLDRVRLFNQYGQAVSLAPEALQQLSSNGEDTPTDPATSELRPGLSVSVFPFRWGTRTGWEASSGKWEPPVQISPLLPASAATPSPTASASPSASPSP